MRGISNFNIESNLQSCFAGQFVTLISSEFFIRTVVISCIVLVAVSEDLVSQL